MSPPVNYQSYAQRLSASTPGLGPWFVNQIRQESGFNPNAVSPAGAIGIAQIVPKYHPGVNPRDPVASLNWAAQYMASLIRKYGNVEQALSVYNSGRPDAYKDPHFAAGQTYNYVRSILAGSGGGATGSSPVAGAAAPPAGATAARSLLDPLTAQIVASNNALIGVPTPPALFGALAAPATVAPGPTPQPTIRRTGKTVQFLEQFAAPYGLTVTSTTGGKHARGSYHYKGRAVDFGGDSARLAALAESALSHPGDFVEMFYTGPGNPGFFIKNGRVLPNSQLDPVIANGHTTHVHLAA